MEAKAKQTVTIEAVITRADGIVENLGVIASTENNTVETQNVEVENNG